MRCVSSNDPHSNYVHCHMDRKQSMREVSEGGCVRGCVIKGFVREYIARVPECY